MRGALLLFIYLFCTSISSYGITETPPTKEYQQIFQQKIIAKSKEELISSNNISDPTDEQNLNLISNNNAVSPICENCYDFNCYSQSYSNNNFCFECTETNLKLINKYLADGQNMKALEILNTMPQDEEVKYAKAVAYNNIKMYSDAKKALKGLITEKAKKLNYEIQQSQALTFTPSYIFLNQELTEVYDLDIRKVEMELSKYSENNLKAFIDYGMYLYISGNYKGDHLEDLTNEIRGGYEGRISEKIEQRTDIGIKVFQNGGALLNTNSWIKYYFNDALSLKIGFKRNNAEQSYLAAVGFPLNGDFTGRVAYNTGYTELRGDLPNRYYFLTNVGGGVFTAQNLPTNPFIEGTAIIGREVYKNPDNLWFQSLKIEAMSYNASYHQNLLSIPGVGPKNINRVFGGYFSPSFTSANTINMNLEGEHKKWNIKYGISGFIGGQVIFSPDQTRPNYGISPYLRWKLNDHLAVTLTYSYSNYLTFIRHFAMINIDIKLFRAKKVH